MFRVLIMFAIGAAIVIAVALLIGSLAGAIVLAVLVAIGLWRTWGLIQSWRRFGSSGHQADPSRSEGRSP